MHRVLRSVMVWLVVSSAIATVSAGAATTPAAPEQTNTLTSRPCLLLQFAPTGKELSRVQLPAPPPTGSHHWVLSGQGSVWRGDASELIGIAAGKEKWRVALPGLEQVKVVSRDGSVWAVSQSDLVHVGADGGIIWRGRGGADRFDWGSFWPDPRDGSCWVVYRSERGLVHLTAKGKETCCRPDLAGGALVAVSPEDGSCWLAKDDVLLHMGPNGRELGRFSITEYGAVMSRHGVGRSLTLSNLAVNTRDGSVWVVTRDAAPRLIHLTSDGRVLGRTPAWAASDIRASIELAGVDPRTGGCWAWVGTLPVEGPSVGAVHGTLIMHYSADAREIGSTDGLAWGWTVHTSPSDDSAWVVGYESGNLYHLPSKYRGVGRGIPLPGNVEAVAPNPLDGSCWIVCSPQL